MKHPLFLILLVGIGGRSMAQSAHAEATGLSVLKTITIELSDPGNSSPSGRASLFNHFEVIDERPDTARIGLHAERFKAAGSRNRQLIFNKPAGREIEAFLNARFARPGAPCTALVVIRTLWLSDANNLREEIVKNPEK